MRLVLIAGLLVGLGWAVLGAAPAASQDEMPPAGPPLSLSGRLRAQGHAVTPDEAVYLDTDEQVTEQYVRLLVVVQELSGMRTSDPDWRPAMVAYLRAMADLDPAQAPVAPPEGLRAVHAQAVAYREQLGEAARQWLFAVQGADPAWLAHGNAAYGAAESARLGWQRALWEYYTGEPAPVP